MPVRCVLFAFWQSNVSHVDDVIILFFDVLRLSLDNIVGTPIPPIPLRKGLKNVSTKDP